MGVYGGTVGMSGKLKTRKIPCQRAPLAWRIKNALRWSYVFGLIVNMLARAFSRVTGIPTLTARLKGKLIKADGTVIDYGVLGHRVVTTAFVNDLVDEFQAYAHSDGFDYHDSGVGSTAENVTDTDIETTDGESRVAGTPGEGASANIYENVGTISYTTTKAIVEHGLFSALTVGILMDRTVFSVINVGNGDSIQFTYELTVTAGS